MSALRYPDAPRQDLIETVSGHLVADPYRWLEDAGSGATTRWAAAQDELARAALEDLPGRERMRVRLTELLAAGSVGVPVWRGGRAFFTRRGAEQEHAVLHLREADGTERVLIDPMRLDPTGTTTLDSWVPSVEGDRLAYQLSRGGDEESLLHVLDVGTGAPVEGPIDRCRYSAVAWLPGGEEYFYVRRLAPELVPADELPYHRRVWRHRVGTDPDTTDVEIHGAGLEITNYYHPAVSRDGRWLTVSASAGTAPRDDVWIAELDGSVAVPTLRPVQVGVDAQLTAWVRGGRLYLFTDRDAPRGRLCVADPGAPEYPNWREVIPERADETLAGAAVLTGADGPAGPDEPEGHVVLAVHSRDATHRLSWWSSTGTPLHGITGLGAGSVAGLTTHPDGGRQAWVGYTDYLTPPMVLTCSLDTPTEVAVWATAPGSATTPAARLREVRYLSADGTPIHAFVLSGAGQPDLPRPTVLYGYGGFNVPLTPAYTATALAWVEVGGVWVVANLRGGSEHGEQWHRAGMRERKQNVFDDFVGTAEGLIRDGWTTPAQLGIVGGSNGGLLVGAALTQRPDLYAAVVCSAPLLDMVRYERFGLGRTWNDEYGTADDPTELGWLLGYSPYHRVTAGTAYPAVMFTTFDSDTRVDPMHARKMCAALQHATTSPRPVLLRREREVGHGARSVSRAVGLAVDQLTFLAGQLGLPLAGPGLDA